MLTTAKSLAIVLLAALLISPAAPAVAAPAVVSAQPIVGVAASPDGKGYWQVTADGGVFAFGSAGFFGSLGGVRLNQPVVGIAAVPSGRGYWLTASDGGVFAFGDAGYYGSMGGKPLNRPVVGIAATPSGKGYWLVASDGGIFAFGDAGFYGSMGGKPLNKPIVGIAASGSGRGYWLVAADGGVFSFGDATFAGSMGGKPLNAPIIGITRAGSGYWLVAADGGIFAFGGAPFWGSLGGRSLAAPVTGIAAAPGTSGYWLVGKDGGQFGFGSAGNYGRAVYTGAPPPSPSGRRLPKDLQLSPAGLQFLASWEGYRDRPYDDPANCTVGVGHLIHRGRCTDADHKQWGVITREQSDGLLAADVTNRFVPAVRAAIPDTPLTQGEFDALLDWAFNVGTGYLTGSSSVRSALAAKPPRYGDVPPALMKYVYLNATTKLCGLYRRRLSDGNLFTTGSYTRLSPACPSGYK